MRFVKWNGILFASNVVLLGFAGYLFYTRPWRTQEGGSSRSDIPTNIVAADVQAEQTAPLTPTIVTVTNNLSWAQLETEDYRAYIQRLRAIGGPEETIRDLIIRDLVRLTAPRVHT